MHAMALVEVGSGRVERIERPDPEPQPGEILLRVLACGVCRTDLHVVDGDLPEPSIPVVPGHEIVGRVEQRGEGVEDFAVGQRVGVPWLGGSCDTCSYCAGGQENLCAKARYTGYQRDGGYATHTLARADYCFALPEGYEDVSIAPLLCAGLIGHRSYRMAGTGKRLGLYGFGAAAHIVAQVATFEGREVFAFSRPGDEAAQTFARELGASWAGDSTQAPPTSLDAAILFAPVGALVPESLRHVRPGGRVVCAGIHMSDIPSFPYRLLWEERSIRSVANLTRQDAREFLALAPQVPVKTRTTAYALDDANQALSDLRDGRLQGAAVLVP